MHLLQFTIIYDAIQPCIKYKYCTFVEMMKNSLLTPQPTP